MKIRSGFVSNSSSSSFIVQPSVDKDKVEWEQKPQQKLADTNPSDSIQDFSQDNQGEPFRKFNL